MQSLHSRRALFEEGALTSAPHGSSPTLAEAELETGMSFSPSSPARSSAQLVGSEARSVTVSSTLRESTALVSSSSEEEGSASVERNEAVGLPPQSVSFEELLEVVTRAVAKSKIEWPGDKEHQEHPKSKLDERSLRSRSLPPHRGLPFFPDLHKELSISWDKTFSARLFNPDVLNYSSALGLNENGSFEPLEEVPLRFLTVKTIFL